MSGSSLAQRPRVTGIVLTRRGGWRYSLEMTLRLIMIALLVGCTPSPGSGTTEVTSTSSSSGVATTGATGTTSGTEPTTSTATGKVTETSSSGNAATTEGAAPCPNGVVDEDEACDDGNSVDGDGCNNDCVVSGTLLWEYRSGESGNDVIRSVAMGPDDEIIVGGSRGGFTRWIGRFEANLTPGWSQVLVGENNETVNAVVVDKDGIYAVGGVGTSNAHDIWVGRLDLDGNLKWEDVSGDDGEDYATQVAFAGQGDIFVAGLDQMAGPSSLWLRRYSPAGDVIWTATWPLGTPVKAFPLGPGLTVTTEGPLVGFSAFKPDTVPEFLIGFPLDGGEPVWQLEIPETSGNILGLAVTSRGDMLTTSSHLFESLMVRRVTREGEVAWSSADCSGKAGRALAVDGNGDIVVIGDGGSNIRLCKFAPDGTIRWGKDVDGGFGDDLGHSVAVDGKNRVIAGGSMRVADEGRDAWLAVFAP